MPMKSSPLLQKVSNLVRDSIFIVKMRKPNIPRLIVSLKKSKKLKKLIMQKHYNYRYIQEYQFSPSNTPLIQYYRKPLKKRSYQDLYPVFFISKCFGMSRNEDEDGRYPMDILSLQHQSEHASVPLKRLPTKRGKGMSDDMQAYPCDNILALQSSENEVVERGFEWDSGSEDDCVDEKAEKFIQKFYEEMRKQRHEALLMANSLAQV